MNRQGIWVLLLCAAVFPNGALNAAPGDGRAAEILNIQGNAQWRERENDNWINAVLQQPLYGGNWIKTGELSRIAVMFTDETQVRLSQNTVLEVKQVTPPGKIGQSLLRVLLGRMWARTKAIPANLAIATPSATAGIRGTDWQLEVEDGGRSTVAVFSGEVEFYNDQGRVVVGANEAAVAEIGKAPTKIILTNFRERVQWVTAYAVDPLRQIALFDSRLDALKQAAATTGDSAQQKSNRGAALADLNRWPEAEKEFTAASAAGDRSPRTLAGLTLAALYRGDAAEARRRLDDAKRAAPQAELTRLADAAVSIKAENFRAAIDALESLTRSADAKQSAAWLILSDIRLYFGEADKAADTLKEGIKKFPDDHRLHAQLARAYLFADRIGDGKAEADLAVQKDPSSFLARIARGDIARLDGDGRTAEKSFREAIALNGADDRGWFGMGQVNSEREEVKPGRGNLGEAIRINPNGPGYRGELGMLETFANNLAAAEAEFSAALKGNPADYIALTGLGLKQLKSGQTVDALESFNKAGLMEPRYARVHVFSAVAYYQLGRPTRALESLKRASELDAKDPFPYFMASLIYTDLFEPEKALVAGREALRLLPNLKSLNQIANNQKGAANLGNSLAFFSLEEWAQSYAQESYYPYWAGSHLFLSDRYAKGFNKSSELFQGFLADPTVFGASNRFQNLVTRPGLYAQAAVLGGSDQTRKFVDPQITINGYANNGVPVAYFLDADNLRVSPGSNPQKLNADVVTGTLGLGVQPSYELGLFAFGKSTDHTSHLRGFDPLIGQQDTKLRDDRLDLGAHYKFSPVSQLWVKVGRGNNTTDITSNIVSGFFVGTLAKYALGTDNDEFGFRHTMTLESQTEITWGAESARQRNPIKFRIVDTLDPTSFTFNSDATNDDSAGAYLSVRKPVMQNFLMQGDLYYQHYRKTYDHTFGFSDLSGNSQEIVVDSATRHEEKGSNRVAPRLGMVVRFAPNQLLRFAYQDWTRPASVATLSPVATAGIPLDDQLIEPGGRLKRAAVQAEWEWSNTTFGRALLDRREVSNPRFSTTFIIVPEVPDLEKLKNRSLLYTANNDLLEATPHFGEGTVNRAAFALNRILSPNWSLIARYEATDSKNTAAQFNGKELPYLPKNLFSTGLTWVTGTRFYVTTQAVYRSRRFADEANAAPLTAGWDAAVKGYWETQDKRFAASFVIDSIFKKQASTYYGIGLSYRN